MGLRSLLKNQWSSMHDKPNSYNWIFSLYNHTIGWNHIRHRKGNHLTFNCTKLDHNNIIFDGKNNEILIDPGAQIRDCTFRVMGDNNRIYIGRDTYLISTELWISKDNNAIIIGARSMINGKHEYPNHIAALEGTEVNVGKDCIFSDSIEIRTGDGHSILNMDGRRINPSQSILIGEHVWVGSGVSITKGVSIIDHCIIGTHSVVTKSVTERYSSVGGNPAHLLKEGVDWSKELLQVDG